MIVPEGTYWVVEGLVLAQCDLGLFSLVELVVILHVQHAPQYVFQQLSAAQVIVFDVLALCTGKALSERDKQLPAVERLRLVFDLRELIKTLDHKTVELVANWRAELTVN